MPGTIFDYKGAIHIHSKYSFDGHVGVAEIVRKAGANGLDFIVITDHANMGAKQDGWEGWKDNVLVLVGQEISPRYNHYLALGMDTTVLTAGDSEKPQVYIDRVKQAGGIGMIAHPGHGGAPLFGVRDYKWADWSVEGFDGFSVWDLMTDWQSALKTRLSALISYLFPSCVLKGPDTETLKKWDELNAHRKIFGFGEIDNHESLKKIFGINFKIFDFSYAFGTIRTHVLLKEPLSIETETAKRQLIGALKDCRAYISFDRWQTPAGFEFNISGGKETAGIGDEIAFSFPSLQGTVSAPGACEIRVLRNGRETARKQADLLRFEVSGPGNYRAEAKIKKFWAPRPWIYTNNIYVREIKN